MEKDQIRKRLPEKPPEGLIRWAMDELRGDLGGEWLVFRGHRVPVMPSLGEIMETNSMAPRRNVWAAECTCTACHSFFYTQKIPGANAIRMAYGEDGSPYPMEPGEPFQEWAMEGIEDAFEGEMLLCPECWQEVELIHASKLKGGRTKRVQVQTLADVDGYGAVIYWMVCRRVDEDGVAYTWADPMDAYVLDERGRLTRYSHVVRGTWGDYRNRSGWEQSSRCEDKWDALYRDWGSIMNRKRGTALYPVLPELGGTTAEKTGITEFAQAGAGALVTYLKFWRKHRNIENLLKAGQTPLVIEIFRQASNYCYDLEREMERYVDLSQRKPHKMLGITRQELRLLRQNGRELRTQELDDWKKYRGIGGRMALQAFLELRPEFGRAGANTALQLMEQAPGTDLDTLARYMGKQRLPLRDLHLLLDSRNMAARQQEGPLSEEQLWPRNLMAAHERLVRIQQERREREDDRKRAEQDGKFRAIREKYGPLLWTDGELCMVLPGSAEELHREGEVLRHCVGGYADRHLSGSDTIFFVRKYRRPERSYYTLDIKMNGGRPTEVQLHGYGNERHGKFKEHTHGIPKKVRSFVDRWEREILQPWWAEEQKKKENTA